MLQVYAKVKWCSKNKVERNKEFDMSSEVPWGIPKAYGVFSFLDDSLFDDPSFPVKKLHHRTLSHLFSKWTTIEDTKDNMHIEINLQIKFGIRCQESILTCQHSQNIKRLIKNQIEARKNAQNNKRWNLSRKITRAWRIFPP
jgi:hypothetical protein